MSLVITGATGHLGRLVVESLLERGVDPSTIVATGRRVEALADLAERGVGIAALDFDDPASIATAVAGASTVLLVSGSVPGNRVAQHSAVIDAAVAAGVQRIVYTSITHADTTELVLAPEHKATEQVLMDAAIDVTILRNGWYTENYADLIDIAAATGEVTASVGDARVASATRRDFADAAAVVLTDDAHANRTYELSGDVAWNFDDLAAALAEITGREVSYRPLTPEQHREQLLAAGLDDGTAGFVVALDAGIRSGALAETPGELSALIGRPTTPLVDGLRGA
ncbi:SDR family oxidoreductase [Marisediminicola senii]|uniref:SDR family oxidoreductase n=1 Tax=Marisediminicola senii TaxID=2711233 RepID=UPI0013EAAA1B|nr:SDR family oxidoreductase [Marisediminicola senii]